MVCAAKASQFVKVLWDRSFLLGVPQSGKMDSSLRGFARFRGMNLPAWMPHISIELYRECEEYFQTHMEIEATVPDEGQQEVAWRDFHARVVQPLQLNDEEEELFVAIMNYIILGEDSEVDIDQFIWAIPLEDIAPSEDDDREGEDSAFDSLSDGGFLGDTEEYSEGDYVPSDEDTVALE